MYLPIDPQPTNVQGWLAATTAVRGRGGEAHNVIIDIADPIREDHADQQILRHVDEFLRDHDHDTLGGVANTIFPQRLLERHGPEDFYSVYADRLLPRMKSMTRDWGRYFERLTIWRKVDGCHIRTINPLKDLVEFMRSQLQSDRTYRNVYEMTIYDPTRDAGKVSNRQCLSFLSFKLIGENSLHLTALFRNHAYIARCLGNLVGLGRLMALLQSRVMPMLVLLPAFQHTHGSILGDGIVAISKSDGPVEKLTIFWISARTSTM